MPLKTSKGGKAMPDGDTGDQKDFIVVGGKRRWFSVPGNDMRFSELQKRVNQERNLAIPERPPESA